eukprot:1187483-Prorocentrum_minimum.AAC.3
MCRCVMCRHTSKKLSYVFDSCRHAMHFTCTFVTFVNPPPSAAIPPPAAVRFTPSPHDPISRKPEARTGQVATRKARSRRPKTPSTLIRQSTSIRQSTTLYHSAYSISKFPRIFGVYTFDNPTIACVGACLLTPGLGFRPRQP